jgi:hypothetical protein
MRGSRADRSRAGLQPPSTCPSILYLRSEGAVGKRDRYASERLHGAGALAVELADGLEADRVRRGPVGLVGSCSGAMSRMGASINDRGSRIGPRQAEQYPKRGGLARLRSGPGNQ